MKWSQARLAREVGLEVNTISRLERGLVGGSPNTQVAIARVLGAAAVHEVFAMPSLLSDVEVAS
jgi:transcriptional regulator with XRE-family HTH domain